MSTTVHQTVVTQHHTSSNSLNDPEWDNRLDALLEDLQSTVSVRGGGAVNGPQGSSPSLAGSREIRTVRTVRTHTRGAGSSGATEVETIGSAPQIQYLAAANPTTVVSERAASPANPELLALQQKNLGLSTTYKTVTYSYDKDGETRVTTPVMPSGNAQLKQNLNELDTLLDDLNKSDTTPRGTRRYEVVRTYTTQSSKDSKDPGITLSGIDPGLVEEPVPQINTTPIPPGRNQVTRTVKTYHYSTPSVDPQTDSHTTTTYQYRPTAPPSDGAPGSHRTSPSVPPHTVTTVRSYTPSGSEYPERVPLPNSTADSPNQPGSTFVTYKYSTSTHSHTSTPEPRPYQAPPEPRPYKHPEPRPYQTPPSPKSYRVAEPEILPYRTNRIPRSRSPTPPREIESPKLRSTPPPDLPSNGTPGSTVISYKYTTHTYHEPGTSPFPVSHSSQPVVEEPEPPHRPFPVSSSPQHPPGTEQKPPKQLDDLMASFSEPGRESRTPASSRLTHANPQEAPIHIPDAVDADETDLLLLPQKKKEPERPQTKNVSGPPVYYPPGVDMFSKKDEPVKAKMKDPGPKVRDEGDGGAVVPVCLPVCCAMPCVIM